MRNGYHPRINAQIIEKTNCILEDMFKMHVGIDKELGNNVYT